MVWLLSNLLFVLVNLVVHQRWIGSIQPGIEDTGILEYGDWGNLRRLMQLS